MPPAIARNTLFYGDNLYILRDYLPDQSVDLIYLDPPFNSNRSYNVLFKEESGRESQAQLAAFEDTWHWDSSTAQLYFDLVNASVPRVSHMIAALHDFIGANQMMAYLVMMTARLVELHRVLKPTGSLYLHCDPTASHYLKIIMDVIFGKQNFRNEIVWCYETAGKSKTHFSRKHDVILFYSKSDKWVFNADAVSIPRKRGKHMRLGVENGREYEEKIDKKTGKVYRWFFDKGRLPFDYWTDIQFINRDEAQRLGYPTQKPIALLERIIQASSNPGDLVLDPFCGCGTAIAAAHKLGRRWIGIDITHLAITLQKYRLKGSFNIQAGADYDVIGEPQDLASARQLAHDDRYQFQWWALSLISAKPLGGDNRRGKKGSDRGVDGEINFVDTLKGQPTLVLVQVKSGHVNSSHIRDLRGALERENAPLGIFLTLEPPTRDMEKEALSAGYYTSPTWGKNYPRIQLITIEQLLAGAQPNIPQTTGTFKRAPRIQKSLEKQSKLDL